MSTGVIVLIVAIVVIVVAVVALLVVRSKRQAQRSTGIGLPDLGALSTTGLDKEHASERPEERPSSPPGKG